MALSPHIKITTKFTNKLNTSNPLSNQLRSIDQPQFLTIQFHPTILLNLSHHILVSNLRKTLMNTLLNLLIRTRPCLLQQCLVTLRQSNQLTHLFHLILWTKIIQSVCSLSLSILVEKTRRIYVLGFLFFHTLLRTFYHTDPNQFRSLLLPTLTLHSPQPLLAYLVMNPLLLLFLLPLKNRYSILRVQVLRILTNLPPHHLFSHNPTVRVNPTIFLQHLNLIQ